MKKSFIIAFCLIFSNIIPLLASNDSTCIVSGNFKIKDSWEPKVYLSVISSFDEMFTISYKMIVSESDMDSMGNFQFNIRFLPKEETLLRIHLVKKGNPSTTLIIGGKDENHFFFIANGLSKINIENFGTGGLFSRALISGSPNTASFNKITELSEYPDFFNYDSTILEKEFVEKVVNERLRSLADSCNDPLISLYALYKSDIDENNKDYVDFCKSYLEKWDGYESTYFRAFKKQFLIKESKIGYVWMGFIIVILLSGLGYYLMPHKNNKLKKLSIQEQKIFYLLQQGASNKDISNECNIELSTVKTHVSNIFSKLKIKSRKEIVNMKLR
jgi:DNA-binding CsgD family transcriptional regulator